MTQRAIAIAIAIVDDDNSDSDSDEDSNSDGVRTRTARWDGVETHANYKFTTHRRTLALCDGFITVDAHHKASSKTATQAEGIHMTIVHQVKCTVQKDSNRILPLHLHQLLCA